MVKMASISKGLVASKVISGLYDGVTTRDMDNLVAETAATMATTHSDYGILAGRFAISTLHRDTKESFSGILPYV